MVKKYSNKFLPDHHYHLLFARTNKTDGSTLRTAKEDDKF